MKTLNTIMMGLAARSGRKVSVVDRMAGFIFILVCAIITLIIGIVTRNGLLLLFGGIHTVMFGIILAIYIYINIRRNRPKW